jgi:hypothetical protein
LVLAVVLLVVFTDIASSGYDVGCGCGGGGGGGSE